MHGEDCTDALFMCSMQCAKQYTEPIESINVSIDRWPVVKSKLKVLSRKSVT